MKAATERKVIHWFHILISIPVAGYIYSSVKDFPKAVFAIQWIIFPFIILSGVWLWKGHVVKKWLRKQNYLPHG
ncbi:MAG TPA: hypothetical protein VF609_05025 [Flavisolibacter sp.]